MDNECVVCGEIIPEGRQVCPNCNSENYQVTFKFSLKDYEKAQGKLRKKQLKELQNER